MNLAKRYDPEYRREQQAQLRQSKNRGRVTVAEIVKVDISFDTPEDAHAFAEAGEDAGQPLKQNDYRAAAVNEDPPTVTVYTPMNLTRTHKNQQLLQRTVENGKPKNRLVELGDYSVRSIEGRSPGNWQPNSQDNY